MKAKIDEIDQRLIVILSTEIQRDGGSSLVRDLKDYVNTIDSLLKRCSIKNSKLLSFLERYPKIFEVNRDSLPHVVYLICNDYCNYSENEEIDFVELDKQTPQKMKKAKDLLEERIISVIKKERSRNERRNFGTNAQFISSVNAFWLMKQCKSQLHLYLRMSGYYQNVYSTCWEVYLVGSNEWLDLVTKEFLSIVDEMKVCNHTNGRIFLRNIEHVDVENLVKTLIEKVNEDGGTHISLSLLLHRNPDLNKMLSGYDLMEIKVRHSDILEPINIFKKDNEIFLQSKCIQKGRMEVDETGLFSVASSKWGKAFASLMAHHCRTTLHVNAAEAIAIDLTASVGGVTLPLAKTFMNVIACEIDKDRSMLCSRNMINHAVEDKVEVINQDSVEYIPIIAQKCSGQKKVVIIDPP